MAKGTVAVDRNTHAQSKQASNAQTFMNSSPAKNFQVLLERISLTASERTAALRRAESVCRNLNNYPLVQDCFVTGSLARSTAIQTFSDVDIVAVIRNEPNISEDSTLAISTISGLLSRTYVEVQDFDSAVRITFPSELGVDVVPALSAGNNSSGFALYKIPIEQRAWIDYAPEEQNQQIAQLTRKLGEGFKHAIRLTKWWSRTHGSPIPSYEIEYIASRTAKNWKHIPPPEEALTAFLGEATKISKKLADRRQSVVREASLIAQEALELSAQGDTVGSITRWRCLLGEQFPAVVF
ncbi:nucleotidyltransferase domain-containing protein [Streptomyces sp. NPDC050287]|uniref:SMODS domain-containing nucleotidyltransferase n=1 Tax=Streptomyces sp. NPDC050287 TaxID=3365608 RepID=UPI0037A2B8E2